MIRMNSKQFYDYLDRYVIENLQNVADRYSVPRPQNAKEAYDFLWVVYKDQYLFSAGFGSFENFKSWAYGGLFDFCLGSAVDTLCDMLEITNEKRHKYTEQEAKTVLLYKIFNRMVKNIDDAYFRKGNEFNIRFIKDKMIKRLEREGRLNQVTPEIEKIMDALDGQPVTAQCWRRVVYDEPVYWCISKDGKIAEYVNEADCK